MQGMGVSIYLFMNCLSMYVTKNYMFVTGEMDLLGKTVSPRKNGLAPNRSVSPLTCICHSVVSQPVVQRQVLVKMERHKIV